MAGRIKIRDINQDPAARVQASAGNDPLPLFNGGTHGSIAYRGASKWEILGPSTPGFALTTNGAGANPSWNLIVTNLVGRATGVGVTIVSAFETVVA
jgi:hypothetical protein